MHIKHLLIENLRSFAHAELKLNVPGDLEVELANVNVLLGGNGSGKTTVLRAIALASLGPLLTGNSGYVPETMVRRKPSLRNASNAALAKLTPAQVEAQIILNENELTYFRHRRMPDEVRMRTSIRILGSTEQLKWEVQPEQFAGVIEKMQYDESSSNFFVVGYGATRRVEHSIRVDESARIKARLRRYERVASLFEDHLGLMPLSLWLPDLAEKNPERHNEVVSLINQLLPDECRMQNKASETNAGREHLFKMHGIPLPFRALSDGYRGFIGWVGDMLFHAVSSNSEAKNSEARLVDSHGVVLIDELDLHLHPEWQRKVMPSLAKTFPRIQFVATTHSPLVVGSLQAANLFVLNETDGATEIVSLPERVRGKNAEEILLSPYFGLESTRSEGVAIELEQLKRQALLGDVEARDRYLARLSQL